MTRYLLVFCFCSFSMYAQSLKMGFGADYKMSSEELHFQFGPSLYLEYSFHELPFSFQFNGHFLLSERRVVQIQYLTGSYGTRLVYFPLKIKSWSPYFCGGVCYNLYHISAGGGLDININNNFSTEISAGVNSNPGGADFFAELSYIFSDPSFESQSTNHFTGVKDPVVKGEYNNNALLLRIGFLFNL